MASLTVIFSAALSMAFETNVASLRASNDSVKETGPGQKMALLFLLVRCSKVETRYRCFFIVIYAELLTVIPR